MRRLADEFCGALGLLTRVPVATHAAPQDCVWAYPFVGALIGAAGGAVFWFGRHVGLPPLLAALWALAAVALLTGALHEDGLADTADGFGGGQDLARKLEIMRDSRIGTFGTIALVLAYAIRAASLAATARPIDGFLALVVAGALGRAGMASLVLALRPARPGGLGATLADTETFRTAVGLAIAVVAAILLAGVGPAIVAAGATLIVGLLTARQIGGYTGDSLGAAAVTAECVALSVLAVA